MTDGRARVNRVPLAEFVWENRLWLRDWRDGQFSSSSRDAEGWPIEMHDLALALEEALDRLDLAALAILGDVPEAKTKEAAR